MIKHKQENLVGAVLDCANAAVAMTHPGTFGRLTGFGSSAHEQAAVDEATTFTLPADLPQVEATIRNGLRNWWEMNVDNLVEE